MPKEIEIYGARAHNLKNIDLKIPHNKLIVFTGLSGSGKSSLAFETIYAEGQRRYIETFSAYGRQFLGSLERPDVDKIDGLSPVISIEQKSTNKNPRSTVGTVTEINDFLRLWFAKTAKAYSPETGEEMVQMTRDQIFNTLVEKYNNRPIYILAPVVRSRKGHYRELFANFQHKGYLYARIDGQIQEIRPNLALERYQIHNIEIVIAKTVIKKEMNPKEKEMLRKNINTALKYGKKVLMIVDKETNEAKFYSLQLMCPTTGISFDIPAPNTFSFNSPQGYCPVCKGLGYTEQVNLKKLVPDTNKSLYDGAIEVIGKIKSGMLFWQIDALASRHKCSIKDAFKDLPESFKKELFYGSDKPLNLKNSSLGYDYSQIFNGLISILSNNLTKKEFNELFETKTCSACNGDKLKPEALSFKIADKNIAELNRMQIDDLYNWLGQIEDKLNYKQSAISFEILKEIRSRIKFLLDVGLDYLSLERATASLSGGESQRIRLATQIGSQLVNVLYILDEPSIGLHQRDNEKLIKSLKNLRDEGNTVIVVEHDEEMMLAADYIVDLGPKAGKHGGEIVAQGSPKEILKKDSLTAKYLSGRMKINIPEKRRNGSKNYLILIGAKGHNLKNVTVKIPLGKFVCITGVSGSGKSSLITDTLVPILKNKIYKSNEKPLEYKKIEGLEHINKIVEVDQSPLGRTPRSNPATYTKVFTDIRKLFEMTPEAQIRGYKASRFSFNVKGGRCETCKGAGVETIEMKLLPDVYITCRQCGGKRYNRETLAVRYKGKSISDILDMTINEAVEFFENHPVILRKIKVLQEVGLGYIKLGQPSTTLSGGENQRVKLASELSKIATGKTLYVLDEPTTGMHFEDIKMLLEVLQKIVDKGNTVIVIEHNLDVISAADYIIDIGPEGGKNGGEIVFSGTPEKLATTTKSYTSKFIKKHLKQNINT